MDLSRILGELIMVPWTEGEAAERERDGQGLPWYISCLSPVLCGTLPLPLGWLW